MVKYMGIKSKNLKKLKEADYNIFPFEEIKNIEELNEYASNNKKFTIRFDRDNKIENLPFYVCNNLTNIEGENIVNEAKKIGCTLLCSNGITYDNDLYFNFDKLYTSTSL